MNELRAEGRTVSQAHFDYIFPVPRNTGEVFGRFGKILVCELNCGQFANYLRTLFPQADIIKCNKVQGQSFLVSELKDAITEAL